MVVTAPTTTPKPHRRWLQFSLRTMLLLVLIASVPLGWLGMKVREARQQWEAVRAIRMVEGVVEYDFERDETGVVQIRPLPADLAWPLLDLVGDDIPICRGVPRIRRHGPMPRPNRRLFSRELTYEKSIAAPFRPGDADDVLCGHRASPDCHGDNTPI